MNNIRDHIHTAREFILIMRDNEKTEILNTEEIKLFEYNQSYLKSFLLTANEMRRHFAKSPSKFMLEKRELFLSHVNSQVHQENLRKNPIALGPALAQKEMQRQ